MSVNKDKELLFVSSVLPTNCDCSLNTAHIYVVSVSSSSTLSSSSGSDDVETS